MSKTYLNNNIPGNNWGIIYSLINLEESSEGYNIVIQSITQSDVKEAPTFDDFITLFEKRTTNTMLIL